MLKACLLEAAIVAALVAATDHIRMRPVVSQDAMVVESVM
jgi:hypothetical protein